MQGGGPKYESAAHLRPRPDEMVLDGRKARIEQVLSMRTRTLTVVLDRLEDIFNMGAVVRTCEAMGLQEIHVVRNVEEPFRPLPSVSKGCEKWIDLIQHEDFPSCRDHLKARGFELWASAIRDDATSLFQLRFDRKVALVFGNERYGVSQEVLAGCDGVFWIPMRGFSQSLNVSATVCAAVTRAIAWREEHGQPAGDLAIEDAAALRERFQRLSVKQGKRIFGSKEAE